eukprot:1605852-Prymnesium_polylepis.1
MCHYLVLIRLYAHADGTKYWQIECTQYRFDHVNDDARPGLAARLPGIPGSNDRSEVGKRPVGERPACRGGAAGGNGSARRAGIEPARATSPGKPEVRATGEPGGGVLAAATLSIAAVTLALPAVTLSIEAAAIAAAAAARSAAAAAALSAATLASAALFDATALA